MAARFFALASAALRQRKPRRIPAEAFVLSLVPRCRGAGRFPRQGMQTPAKGRLSRRSRAARYRGLSAARRLSLAARKRAVDGVFRCFPIPSAFRRFLTSSAIRRSFSAAAFSGSDLRAFLTVSAALPQTEGHGWGLLPLQSFPPFHARSRQKFYGRFLFLIKRFPAVLRIRQALCNSSVYGGKRGMPHCPIRIFPLCRSLRRWQTAI